MPPMPVRRTAPSGFLVTDWGDFGHHQYLPVSEPGLAAAAAFSWCASAHGDLGLDDLAVLLDAHAFDDPAGGVGRGARGARFGPSTRHSAASEHVAARRPPPVPSVAGRAGPDQGSHDVRARRGRGRPRLGQRDARFGSRPGAPDGELVKDELGVATSWLELACDDARERLAGDGTLGSVPQPARDALAARCEGLAEQHRRLWLERNRPGGLDDSTAWLDHLKECYVSGRPDPAWFGPFG